MPPMALNFVLRTMRTVRRSGEPLMSEVVVARSAKLGDVCVRDIPRLLTKEEIRDLSQLDSVKFTAAALLEFGLIAAAVVLCQIWWNPVTYVLAVIVIGSRINSLGGL